MKNFLFAAIIIFLSLIMLSCKKDNPILPEEQPQLNLTLADTSCTEAWLKLTTSNIPLPVEVTLLQDSSVVQTISLSSADTLLYVDSLLPHHSYKFHTTISDFSRDLAFGGQSYNLSSNSLNVTTMDTTSHNFTWQTWTFGGQAGSCTLYDVAIINQDDIWAVGEIYLLDSTGVPDPNAYNAVHWNGNQWELKRIRYYGSCSHVVFPPLEAVWAFSDSNIVVTNGGSIGWFDGNSVTLDCQVNLLLTGIIKKIWGKSNNDLYVVGYNGNIIHYLNMQWKIINSGSDAFINDIWGVTNPDDNKTEIYCAVSFLYQPGDRKILTIDDEENVDSIGWMIDKRVNSIWTDNSNFIYAAGDGVFNNKSGQWIEESGFPNYYVRRIRGTGLNNIYAVGDYGFCSHYSGTKWDVYPDLYIQGIYMGLDVKNDMVVMVGLKEEQAIIVVGKRN